MRKFGENLDGQEKDQAESAEGGEKEFSNTAGRCDCRGGNRAEYAEE